MGTQSPTKSQNKAFYFFVDIPPYTPLEILTQQHPHEKRSDIVSGKTGELLMKIHLVIRFIKKDPSAQYIVCLDTKATLT